MTQLSLWRGSPIQHQIRIPVYRVIRRTSVYIEGLTGRRALNPFTDIVDMVFFTADGRHAEDRTEASYVISRADHPRCVSYKARSYQYREGDESYQVIYRSTTPYCKSDDTEWNAFIRANKPTIVKI